MGTHTERCKACKTSVAQLLSQCFGRVIEQCSLNLGAGLDDYLGTAYYEELRAVYDAVRGCREHNSFVRARKLPAVDYYLPAQRVVVEFDESQHFTQLRRVALETYPATLRLGFDRHRWIELSRKLDRHDNDPYDRDETRAWYDTLRDFAGVGPGLLAEARPAVRLYARDEVLCQLDLSNRDVVRSLLTTYFNHVDRIGA